MHAMIRFSLLIGLLVAQLENYYSISNNYVTVTPVAAALCKIVNVPKISIDLRLRDFQIDKKIDSSMIYSSAYTVYGTLMHSLSFNSSYQFSLNNYTTDAASMIVRQYWIKEGLKNSSMINFQLKNLTGVIFYGYENMFLGHGTTKIYLNNYLRFNLQILPLKVNSYSFSNSVAFEKSCLRVDFSVDCDYISIRGGVAIGSPLYNSSTNSADDLHMFSNSDSYSVRLNDNENFSNLKVMSKGQYVYLYGVFENGTAEKRFTVELCDVLVPPKDAGTFRFGLTHYSLDSFFTYSDVRFVPEKNRLARLEPANRSNISQTAFKFWTAQSFQPQVSTTLRFKADQAFATVQNLRITLLDDKYNFMMNSTAINQGNSMFLLQSFFSKNTINFLDGMIIAFNDLFEVRGKSTFSVTLIDAVSGTPFTEEASITFDFPDFRTWKVFETFQSNYLNAKTSLDVSVADYANFCQGIYDLTIYGNSSLTFTSQTTAATDKLASTVNGQVDVSSNSIKFFGVTHPVNERAGFQILNVVNGPDRSSSHTYSFLCRNGFRNSVAVLASFLVSTITLVLNKSKWYRSAIYINVSFTYAADLTAPYKIRYRIPKSWTPAGKGECTNTVAYTALNFPMTCVTEKYNSQDNDPKYKFMTLANIFKNYKAKTIGMLEVGFLPPNGDFDLNTEIAFDIIPDVPAYTVPFSNSTSSLNPYISLVPSYLPQLSNCTIMNYPQQLCTVCKDGFKMSGGVCVVV